MAAQDAFSFEDWFGIPNLITKDGEQVSTASLNGKYLAIYCSASWCPPCQKVTPMLASVAYPTLKEQFDVEFVLLPFCRTEQKFNEYLQKMPWPSVPYDQKDAVADRLPINVKGFPTVYIVDPQGNVITSKGLQAMLEEPENFPFRPPAWESFFPEASFVKNDGTVVEANSLADKTLLIYFSAHWCPPCRGFTPTLAQFYNKYRESKNFEVIFVSKDSSQEEFDSYFATHPWLAVPYENTELKSKLVKYLPHSGIPTLAMLSADGEIQRMNTRMCLVHDKEGEEYPWPVDTFFNPREINDKYTVILFQQNDNIEKQREREAWLAQPSLESRQKMDDSEWNYVSVRSVPDNSIEDQILEKCEEIPEQGAMVLLTLWLGGFYYHAPLPESEQDFQDFISAYEAKTLQRYRIQ